VRLVLRVLLRRDSMDLQVIAMMSAGRKAAFTNLGVVRIVVVPFTTAGIGFLVVVGAKLLLGIVVHHVNLRQVDLFLL